LIGAADGAQYIALADEADTPNTAVALIAASTDSRRIPVLIMPPVRVVLGRSLDTCSRTVVYVPGSSNGNERNSRDLAYAVFKYATPIVRFTHPPGDAADS
jgi:hypothetical protein